MTLADQDTLDFQASTHGDADVRSVGLTLLAHPDATRIGEIAVLFSSKAGGVRKLSRLEPEFHKPGQALGTPLASATLSRRPLLIRTTAEGSLLLEPDASGARVWVEGEQLVSPRTFALDELERGLVIELAECVLLLLHNVAASPKLEADLGLLGNSIAIRKVRADVRRVADLDVCVLIRGESGTGKELVARAIHELSPRRGRPYVAVNAAAIPTAMAASALFGHARGAFTGALNKSAGYFGHAEYGTLFLDEIGEVPRQIQALLLRAVREGEIQPVGDTEPRKVDVRVLTATDAGLEELAERGDFSMPLLRRLEAYCLRVPPLRLRRDDIARLFFHFLRQELTALGEQSKLDEPPAARKPWVPTHLVRALLDYAWPGNVAELNTLARRIAIDNRGLKQLQLDAWVLERLPGAAGVRAQLAQPSAALEPALAKRDPRSLSDTEVASALRASGFKVGAAAAILGVSRSWLNTRIEFCEGLRKAKDLGPEEILQAAQSCAGSVPTIAEQLQVSEHGLKLRINALGLELG